MLKSGRGLMVILGVDIHRILAFCGSAMIVRGDAILQMDYAYYDMHFLIHFLMDYCTVARVFVKIYLWGSSLEEGYFH